MSLLSLRCTLSRGLTNPRRSHLSASQCYSPFCSQNLLRAWWLVVQPYIFPASPVRKEFLVIQKWEQKPGHWHSFTHTVLKSTFWGQYHVCGIEETALIKSGPTHGEEWGSIILTPNIELKDAISLSTPPPTSTSSFWWEKKEEWQMGQGEKKRVLWDDFSRVMPK